MDDNVFVFWSLLLAVMFFYFGFQVRNGKLIFWEKASGSR